MSKQYAVIQSRLRGGQRTFFVTEKEAETEGRDLLTRRKRYHNYDPPATLLIVKVVGVLEISSKRRKLRASDTNEED